jgi:hypothetical protein
MTTIHPPKYFSRAAPNPKTGTSRLRRDGSDLVRNGAGRNSQDAARAIPSSGTGVPPVCPNSLDQIAGELRNVASALARILDQLAVFAGVKGDDHAHTLVAIIVNRVSVHYGVSRVQLLGLRRRERIVWARFVAVYFSKKLTELSLYELGAIYSQHPGTIRHAIIRTRERLETEPRFREELGLLEAQIVAETRPKPRKKMTGNRQDPGQQDKGHRHEPRQWTKDV